RLVVDRHPHLLQPMQQAEAQGHLLEAAGRNHSDNDALRHASFESRQEEVAVVHRRGAAKGKVAILQRETDRIRPQRRKRLLESPRVPIPAFGEDRDPGPLAHPPKDLFSSDSSRRPAWKLFPLSSAVTVTRAGLNSIGSMA